MRPNIADSLLMHSPVNSPNVISTGIHENVEQADISLLDSLKKTVANGRFDSYEAAKIIIRHKEQGSFSYAEYEGFLSSEECQNVRSLERELFPPPCPGVDFAMLLSKIREDVSWAVHGKTVHAVQNVKRLVASELQQKTLDIVFNKSAITQSLKIDAIPPFKGVTIADLMTSWKYRKNSTPIKKINDSIRFILGEITVDPQDIKKYSYGVMPSKGTHKLLPLEISRVLEEFILQATGLSSGLYKLLSSEDAATSNYSELYATLGDTESSRKRIFASRKKIKEALSGETILIIQKALVHLRRCTCTISASGQRRWIRIVESKKQSYESKKQSYDKETNSIK